MGNLICSTKGKNNSYKLIFVLLGIAAVIMGIIMFAIAMDMPTYRMSESQKMLMIAVPAISFGFALFAFLFAGIHGGTYVNLYATHWEGKAMQGKGAKTFYLRPEQIKSVGRESYYLCLHTDIGELKILCNQEAAQQVIAYFHANIGNGPSSNRAYSNRNYFAQ